MLSTLAILTTILAGGSGDDSASNRASNPNSVDTSVTTDDQFLVVEPHEEGEVLPADEDGRRPLRVRGEFGHGVEFATYHQSFAVQLRARAQLQAFAIANEQAEDTAGAQIRRMRLLFGGHAMHRRVSYYIQLGFSDNDLERDRPVPLRDAFVTTHVAPAFNVRVGQMKVPFDRQRVMSSSKLQLVERSDVVNELNLDRDIGLQVYGDIFNRHVRYHLGVFSGNGRNRFNESTGLLYAGRLRVFLTDVFDDDVESDLSRARRLRIAVSAAAGYNDRSRRRRSTQGEFIDGGEIGYLHLAADAVLKFAGLSVTAQYLSREAREQNAASRGFFSTSPFAASTRGWFGQIGYLTPASVEFALRYGHLEPFGPSITARSTELTAGVSWYVRNHDLKVQASHTARVFENHTDQLSRVQMQLFF